MAELVYRSRQAPARGGYVELQNLHDGDTLSEIEALIVTLKDLDYTLEMINGTLDTLR